MVYFTTSLSPLSTHEELFNKLKVILIFVVYIY